MIFKSKKVFFNKQKPQNYFDFLPFMLLILMNFFHSKQRERKKLGFNSGDVDFAIHFTVVLACGVDARVMAASRKSRVSASSQTSKE